jgi:hypothetical protein
LSKYGWRFVLASPLREIEQPTTRSRRSRGSLGYLRGRVQRHNRRLYRAFLLREELPLLYHLDDPTLPPEHLDAWLAWASRSRLRPFVQLARTLARAPRPHSRRYSPRPQQRTARGPELQDPPIATPASTFTSPTP